MICIVCEQPRFLPFVHGETGHVISKRLELVSEPGLREILSRGPKYRMRPVQPFSSTEVNPSAKDRIVEMVGAALDSFQKSASESYGYGPMEFAAWEDAILAKTAAAATGFTKEERDELERWSPSEVGWSVAASREMQWLHSHFVVQPADKETGVLTFTCRKHWETMLLKEVHETPTYSFVGAGARSHVLPEGSNTSAATMRANRLQAAAQRVARPDTRIPTRVTLAMRVTHCNRVLRARHVFGVLAVGRRDRQGSERFVDRSACI